MESDFRLWSFGIYYHRAFATVMDNTLRFALAIQASSQPIRNRAMMEEWYAKGGRKGCRSVPQTKATAELEDDEVLPDEGDDE